VTVRSGPLGFPPGRVDPARTAPMALRMLPIFVIAFIFFGLKLPPTPQAAALWVAAVAGAALLGAAISALLTVTHLWTIAGDGVNRILPVFVYVFSGLIIPLPLFPDWMQPFLNAMPFRGLADTPFRIYMGHLPPAAARAACATAP